MTTVSAPYGGDISGMARSCKPVVYCGANPPSLNRRIARAMMAGDQQDDAVAAPDRLLETAIDRGPGHVEVHAVKVEYAVRFDRAAAEPLVPAAIECLVRDRRSRSTRDWSLFRYPWPHRNWFRFLREWRGFSVARQRPDGGRYARPQLGLLRVEGAHAPRSPSGPGSALRRSPTYRPRSRPHPARRPRKYQNGSGP